MNDKGDILQNDFLNKQYKLLEAWTLFAEKGIYKTDGIQSAEIKLWQQSKLLGVDPLVDNIRLEKEEEIDSDIAFDKEINLWALENSVSLLLFNEKKILQAKSAFQFENISIERGASFSEKKIGVTSLTLSIMSNDYKCLKGAQHYTKAFQYLVTRSYPVLILGEKYYVVSINHINNESKEIKNEIKKHINLFIERIGGKTEAKTYKYDFRHFESGVYEISSNGKISHTELSHLAILPEDENILSIFEDCSIAKLFAGEKQILKAKNKMFQTYLITPISKKNQFSLYILIEKLEANLDLFNDLHTVLNESFCHFINKNILELDLIKRLKALANSSMPVIFIIDELYDQIMFSNYINTLRLEGYNYNVNLDPAKNLDKSFELKLKKIQDWNLLNKKHSVHIFHLELIDDNSVYRALNSCFYSSNAYSKYFLYISKDFYSKLAKKYENIMASFKLNIMEIDKDILDNVRLSYEAVSKKTNSSQNQMNVYGQEEKEEISDQEIFVSRFKRDKNFSLKEIEKTAILDALVSVDYNMTKASILLDISRSTLYRKLKEYKITIK